MVMEDVLTSDADGLVVGGGGGGGGRRGGGGGNRGAGRVLEVVEEEEEEDVVAVVVEEVVVVKWQHHHRRGRCDYAIEGSRGSGLFAETYGLKEVKVGCDCFKAEVVLFLVTFLPSCLGLQEL
ncbi:hypothetical protein E2C01_102511 [Portunus trituberculatus]|uniref:Uncharacterized protein n=1 Tax=Portunus trituberculatus TaxID=210409 RepID=A0A5B7KIP9_PORTR|nr:hypothetical protein [Portunus trituberculatus]